MHKRTYSKKKIQIRIYGKVRRPIERYFVVHILATTLSATPQHILQNLSNPDKF